MTGRQARASPISSTPKKKKWELEARNGRVAGRQLLIRETWRRHSNNQTPTPQCSKLSARKRKTHLLYIEDKKVFNGADGGQHRTVKSTDPANCLTVDNLQNVLRNGELLLAPPLGQPTVTVPHDQPDGRTRTHGQRLQEQRQRRTVSRSDQKYGQNITHAGVYKPERQNIGINLHIC